MYLLFTCYYTFRRSIESFNEAVEANAKADHIKFKHEGVEGASST